MAKTYDPLWELLGEKVALQGMVRDVDGRCPNCHVTVHIGSDARVGQKVECGVCGEPLVIEVEDGSVSVVKDSAE